MSAISFSISAREGRARAGTLHTPHGVIETPAFVPVGTKGSVKGLTPRVVEELGAQTVLANTYHLYLEPGAKVIEEAGGLGKFMAWDKPTFTDSGGYQVFSLGAGFKRSITTVREEDKKRDVEGVSLFDEDVQSQHGQLAIIDEEGVSFTSHIDGSLHRFTPERSIEIQHALGADVFFAFDECTAPDASYEYQKEAMFRTHRWATRSLASHRANLAASRKQGVYGIAQGGPYDDLREESTKAIAEMGFDGFGLGGSFTRKNGIDMLHTALKALTFLPETLPRHGLGVGEPTDLLRAIAEGVDTFDCVAPTRHGRHGTLYTKMGTINLLREQYKNDFSPLDPDGVIPGTEGFSRAYVSHLIRSGEVLGGVIASMHNLGFILGLVDGARAAIHNGMFTEYCAEFLSSYAKS